MQRILVCDDDHEIVEAISIYLTGEGFKVLPAYDGAEALADGFYFTLYSPGLSGGALLRALLEYGVSAISLGSTGSERTEGLRACVSHVAPEQYATLEARMAQFQKAYGTRE